MARISGTVSRNVPLDSVLGRPLLLSGTFDLYVTQDELGRVQHVLDALIASGIMTQHSRSTESDGLISNASAPVVDAPASGIGAPAPLHLIPHAIPDAAGDNTYTFTAQKKMEVVTFFIHKSVAGAGNTIKLQDNAAVDISNAVAADTDKAVTSPATLDQTKKIINAGSTYKFLAHRAAGSMAAEVYLVVILR